LTVCVTPLPHTPRAHRSRSFPPVYPTHSLFAFLPSRVPHALTACVPSLPHTPRTHRSRSFPPAYPMHSPLAFFLSRAPGKTSWAKWLLGAMARINIGCVFVCNNKYICTLTSLKPTFYVSF